MRGGGGGERMQRNKPQSQAQVFENKIHANLCKTNKENHKSNKQYQ